MKFELAKQDKVMSLEDKVAIVVKKLGHPEALVTDENRISDFRPLFRGTWEFDKSWLPKLSAKFGFPIAYDDLIVDVAKKIGSGKPTPRRKSCRKKTARRKP